MTVTILAGALTLVPLAVYHLFVVRRLRAKLAEVRSEALQAYSVGYEHGAQHTHAIRDAEAESIRRNAYNRGRRDASRRHVEAA